MHVEVRRQLVELVLTFHHVVPSYCTQMSSLVAGAITH